MSGDICCSTYLLAGFFGASMYGTQTSSNVLENEWIPGIGTFILNMLITVSQCLRSGGGHGQTMQVPGRC